MERANSSIPSHVFGQIGSVSWDNIIRMSAGYNAHVKHKSAHVRKLAKELNLSALLLMERARSQENGGMDPRIFVELSHLIKMGDGMSRQYNVDLRDFNSFLRLLMHKVKKQSLARHEPEFSESAAIAPTMPISESKFGKYKAISEGEKKEKMSRQAGAEFGKYKSISERKKQK